MMKKFDVEKDSICFFSGGKKIVYGNRTALEISCRIFESQGFKLMNPDNLVDVSEYVQ